MQCEDVRVKGADEIHNVGEVRGEDSINVESHMSKSRGECGWRCGKGVSYSQVNIIGDRWEREYVLEQWDSSVLFGWSGCLWWEGVV